MIAVALGWVGMVGTFVAYVLVARGHLKPDSRRYALLNVVGGLAGAVGCGMFGVWSSAVSNAIWAVVGLHSLLRDPRPAEVDAAPARVLVDA